MRPQWLPQRRPIRRSRTRGGERAGAAQRLGRAVATGATSPFTYRSELPSVAGDSRRPLTFRRHDADAIEAELYSHLIPIKRRIWLQRAVLLLVRGAVLIAALYLIAATFELVHRPLPPPLLSVGATFVAALALLLIVQQRVSFFDAARVLDRRLGLNQVIGTAVELTGANADGRMARLQMRRATDALRRIESRDAIRIGLPMRDLRALAVLAVATLLFTYLATLNIAWPGSPPTEELAIDPAAEIAAEIPFEATSYEGDAGSTLDPELFNSSLDDYMAGLENQNLSPEEIAQRMAEIQAALAQRAEALNRQRQALSDLADALSDSSAASDAAESIRKGDYEKAAQQLGELGKQSKQLSQRARQDLARRLNDAARKVAPNNADLAARMQKAAQQLNSNEAQGAEQSLSELGEGVQQAGDQMKQLEDSSSAMDPSMMDPSMMGEGAMPSDLSAEDTSGLSNFEGSGTEGEMGDMGADQFADSGFGEGAASEGNGQGMPQRSDLLGEDAGRGAGAGGGQGGADQGRGQDPRGNTSGKILELRGRPSDQGGPGQLDNEGKVPLVSSNDGSIGGAAGAGARSVIVDPLSVRGEQNFVPWEKRQIVRDFFTGTGK
jgi:hypothetical protein